MFACQWAEHRRFACGVCLLGSGEECGGEGACEGGDFVVVGSRLLLLLRVKLLEQPLTVFRIGRRTAGVLEAAGIHKLSYQLSKLVGSFRPSRGPTLGSALGKPLLTTLLLQEAALGAHILFQRQHDKRLLSPWSVFVGGLHGGREVGGKAVASDLLGGDVPK